jgi:maltooligosyltrehalose trehalohydrolase
VFAQRRREPGAHVVEGGTSFRVWAPEAKRVEVVPEGGRGRLELERQEDGYFFGVYPGMRGGNRYKFSMDGGEGYPDPASRYQPEGPHGPSEVVDAGAYRWGAREREWGGVSIDHQVLYEVHVGTFTREGTFAAAAKEFGRLREMGITVLELMPVAEFAGRVGWGYDGVALFAPFHHYGGPDDLRRMIEAAHGEGLAVILDVVYNHLGPEGNYLGKFARQYFAETTEWGEGINFDGEQSGPVREFFLANARQWIAEYHFDGLRLDATQAIKDRGAHGKHILREIGEAVREAAQGRETIVLAENEPQDSCLVCSVEKGGYGLDAVWNDDFHHSATVCLTGKREAYYSDHLGRPQEFISAVKYGYLYQGQYYSWQKQRRGVSSLGLNPKAFVTFIENHDQVANLGRSRRMRMLASPGKYRAMTGLWLLMPGTPMFFMGQEYGATTPFHYFAGHTGDLARAVSEGRADFMRQFPSQDTPEMRERFADPNAEETFESSRLDAGERGRYPEIERLHRDLLELRRTDPVLRRQEYGRIDGAVLGESCFVLRYFTDDEEDLLLVVNFGAGLDLPHLPEPLTAPPAGAEWEVMWASEWPEYGGSGATAPGRSGAWKVDGETTMLLRGRAVEGPVTPEREKSGLKAED